MQPPHTFIGMAGGSPAAALGLPAAARRVDRERPAPASRLRWSARTFRADHGPLAASRRVGFAVAARRLLSGQA